MKKRKEQVAELRGLSLEELQDKRSELAEEKMKLRFRNAQGQLEQGHRLGQVRRALARVETVITEKQQEAAQAAA